MLPNLLLRLLQMETFYFIAEFTLRKKRNGFDLFLFESILFQIILLVLQQHQIFEYGNTVHLWKDSV